MRYRYLRVAHIRALSSANIPVAFPDECVRSYGARWATAGGHAWISADSSSYSWCKALIERGGWSAQQFLQDHTYVGYRRFVSAAHVTLPSQRPLAAKADMAVSPPIQSCRYCPTCVEDDLLRLGVAYLRRIHHLTGVDRCVVHGEDLMEQSGAPFSKLTFQTPRRASGAPTVVAHPGAPVVRRFELLSSMAVGRTEAIDVRDMSEALKQRAQQIALRTSAYGTGRLLSDWVREILPPAWLAKHFPAVNDKVPGTYISQLDDVFRSRHVAHKTASYLLAMAMLWDRPDEAMSTCTAAVRPYGSDPLANARNALQAVLQGATIRDACRLHGANLKSLAEVIRASVTNLHEAIPACEVKAASGTLF